jgi:hypothetical protein
MKGFTSVWMTLAAVLALGGNAPEEPAEWKAKREAARSAVADGKPNEAAATQFRRDHPGLISLAHVTGSGYRDADVIRFQFEKAHKSSPPSSKP